MVVLSIVVHLGRTVTRCPLVYIDLSSTRGDTLRGCVPRVMYAATTRTSHVRSGAAHPRGIMHVQVISVVPEITMPCMTQGG